MIPDPCFAQTVGRRRVFWTTQPESCGDYFLCGAECGIPGLEYINVQQQGLPLALVESASAVDTIDAHLTVSASLNEVAIAGDTIDAKLTVSTSLNETAVAGDTIDATIQAAVLPSMLLPASRAGLRSAVVTNLVGKTVVVSDIGAVR